MWIITGVFMHLRRLYNQYMKKFQDCKAIKSESPRNALRGFLRYCTFPDTESVRQACRRERRGGCPRYL